MGIGKEGAESAAGVGSASRRAGGVGGDMSHEMTECRKEEASEGLIREHYLNAYCVPSTVWALGTR